MSAEVLIVPEQQGEGGGCSNEQAGEPVGPQQKEGGGQEGSGDDYLETDTHGVHRHIHYDSIIYIMQLVGGLELHPIGSSVLARLKGTPPLLPHLTQTHTQSSTQQQLQ